MKPPTAFSAERLTVLAASLSLLALVMMAVGILVPGPLPVVLAMSVGQLIGAGALALYLLAVFVEMRRNRRNLERARRQVDDVD